jgi:hypothetical protein
MPDAYEYDFGCSTGSACVSPNVCCATPSGSAVSFACASSATCPMADKITCDGPDECAATPSTPVCCGVYVPSGAGTFPRCDLQSIGTSCTSMASCTTSIPYNCTSTKTVQLCHTASDCHDSNNNLCCSFGSGSAALTFCTDQTTANLGSATCHP